MYKQQILTVLSEVGERGISVAMLAKHIYNMNVTLFSSPDYQEVRQYVGQYLLRNARSAKPLVESTGRRGYYRLNSRGRTFVRKTDIDIQVEQSEEETEEVAPQPDLSLSLFPELRIEN